MDAGIDQDQGIARALVEAYGSLSEPSFAFVEKRYKTNPYADVVSKLADDYEVSETTDLNDDLATTLVLSSETGRLGLRLSLVGRYAAVADENGRILDADEIAGLAPAHDLVRSLLNQGIRTLGRTWLRREVPFGPRRSATTLYELLFSCDEAVFV